MSSLGPWLFVIYGAAAIAWLALAWAFGQYGASKGYSFWLCFVVGLSASPLAGWSIIALLPERNEKYTVPPELMLAIEQEKARMKAQEAGGARAGTAKKPA